MTEAVARKKPPADAWADTGAGAYSKDYWDRILMHGCGYAAIPSTPGHHLLTADTWKPIVDLRTRIE